LHMPVSRPVVLGWKVYLIVRWLLGLRLGPVLGHGGCELHQLRGRNLPGKQRSDFMLNLPSGLVLQLHFGLYLPCRILLPRRIFSVYPVPGR